MSAGEETSAGGTLFPLPLFRSSCHAYAAASLRYAPASVHANRGPGRVSCCHQEENCLSDVLWIDAVFNGGEHRPFVGFWLGNHRQLSPMVPRLQRTRCRRQTSNNRKSQASHVVD